jgi:hypothetical protein
MDEAFQIGDSPDFINPERKDQFSKRTHVLGRHPALPDDEDSDDANYGEKMASPMYVNAIKKLSKYTGRRMTSVDGITKAMIIAIHTALGIEASHKEELEAMAVQLVLDLPEYSGVRLAEENGDLEFDVELTSDMPANLSLSKDAPEENEEDQLVNAINNVDGERSKRIMVNAMISGSAESASYAFELYNSELSKIDPRLPELYGVIMACTDLGYWIMPDSAVNAVVTTGMSNGGESSISDNEGTPVIYARGLLFPILVHEIVKSLVEYLSYSGLPGNAEIRKRTLNHTDNVDYETVGLMMGPEILNKIKSNLDDKKKFAEMYSALVQLEPDEFNDTVKLLLKGGDRAKRKVNELISSLKGESMNVSRLVSDVLCGNKPSRDLIEAYIQDAGTETAPSPVKPKVSPKTGDNPKQDPEKTENPSRNPWHKRRIDPNSAPRPKA